MLNRALLSLSCAFVVLAAASAVSPRASGEDFDIAPTPPTTDQDLEVSYLGLETEVDYQVEGEKPVRIDVSKNGSFRIPKDKLKGKKFVRIVARGGGEAGYLVVYFKS